MQIGNTGERGRSHPKGVLYNHVPFRFGVGGEETWHFARGKCPPSRSVHCLDDTSAAVPAADVRRDIRLTGAIAEAHLSALLRRHVIVERSWHLKVSSA